MSSTTRTRSASRASSARPARPAEPAPRPLPVAAAVGAAAAVGVGLVLCMAVALVGWFLADAGAHGQTTDALRVGAEAWLLGLGATVHAAGVPIGVAPLGLTALLLLVGFRTGRWAARDADDASPGLAVAVSGLVHLVLAVVVAVLAPQAGASVSVPQAMLGGLLVGTLGGGAGVAVGRGHLSRRWAAAPAHLRTVLVGAIVAAAGVLACAALLVTVSLLVSFDAAATTFSALQLSTGDALMLLVVSVLLAPNAVLLGVSWLSGPGFALGTGTSITATAVTLGPLPAFPMLAALPGSGSQPGWCAALLAVPPLCAAVAGGLAQRRSTITAWDSAGLRGFGTGAIAGVVLTVLAALAGGALGTGRLADLGVPTGELLVTMVAGMGLGGLVGGLAVTAWQRRRLPSRA